ncbi:MAG: ABC transporter transmembrane domain-containing protein, partial [Acidimicrobiia bacterium]
MRGGGGGGPFGPHPIEEKLTREDAHKVMRRLTRLLRAYRRQIVLAALLLVAQTACLLAGPALVRYGIDHGLEDGNTGNLNRAAIIYLVIAFIGAYLGRSVIRMVARVGETFLRDLRERVFRHLLSLGLDFFEREKTGRLVARMTSDIEALQELVSMGLVMFVQN